MHTTTCSWATIISLIRAIVRMLCNWHGDILTRRPKKVKQVHVQEIVTKFFAMIGGIALIAGCAVGDLDWHWIWELDPFNTSASPLYCPTLVNFYKLQLFLPKRHLDFLSGSPGSVWNIGGRPFQSSLSGICEKTNNPKLWKFVPDQLWHKSWNIPPRGIYHTQPEANHRPHITWEHIGCEQQVMAFKCKFCAFFFLQNLTLWSEKGANWIV